MQRKQRTTWAPMYRALSDALGKCLPLPDEVTVHLDLYLWQRLRDELGTRKGGRIRRLAFDTCPVVVELWGSRVSVWPK